MIEDIDIVTNCPLFKIDVYKYGHPRQYAKGTSLIYSNHTARKSRNPNISHTVFVGLQAVLIEFEEDMRKYFFDIEIERFMRIYHAVFNDILGPQPDCTHIRDLHALGYNPIRVKALAEGSKVRIGTPYYTMENTHDDFFWYTNTLETYFSEMVWGPINSATTAARYREVYEKWAEHTGSPKDFIMWQGHDFSARGMFGNEAAAMSGLAHLIAFSGSDTVQAGARVSRYYSHEWWNMDKGFGGVMGSVAATEHSVSMNSLEEYEFDTLNRLLTEVYPSGILSFVSDTWNLWRVITEYLPKLKNTILNRPGKLVVRPDSGDPYKILCGDDDAPAGSPENLGVVRLLWNLFGGTQTAKGFNVLDSHIGTIYGDAITVELANRILGRLAELGFASCNVVFGHGSYSYQFGTRDDHGQAIKSTFSIVNGVSRNLLKNPITDSSKMKKSLSGRIRVIKGLPVTDQNVTGVDELRTVFDNELIVFQTWAEVRQNFFGSPIKSVCIAA